MKKLMAGLLLFSTMSTYATSDFEKGYNKGQQACNASANIVIEHFSTAYPIDQNILVKKLSSQCIGGKLSKVNCVDKGDYYVNTVVCAALCNQE